MHNGDGRTSSFSPLAPQHRLQHASARIVAGAHLLPASAAARRVVGRNQTLLASALVPDSAQFQSATCPPRRRLRDHHAWRALAVGRRSLRAQR